MNSIRARLASHPDHSMEGSIREREVWLDNLKLLFIATVFIGHYFHIFYGQFQDASVLTGGDILVFNMLHSYFNVFYNASYWVFGFCLVSGWLAWQKEIDGFSVLVKALIHRYMRFVIPIFFANSFTILIDRTIGWPLFEVGRMLNRSVPIFNYDAVGAWSVVCQTLLLDYELVGPLWVLRYIFVGTCVIYCLKYALNYFYILKNNAYLVLLNGWMLVYVLSNQYATTWFYAAVVVAGGGLHFCGRADNVDWKRDLISGVGLVGIAVSLNIWTFHPLWAFLTAYLFLVFSLKCKAWRTFLERNSLFNRIAHLSFTIYIIHSQLLYSVAMFLYLQVTRFGVSYPMTVVVNFIVSSAIILLICEGFYLLIQKKLDRFIFSKN